MKISHIEPGSIAEDLGLAPGDDLLEINGRKVLDAIDFRFQEGDPSLILKVARGKEVTLFEIEKEADETIGAGFEEMSILSCGNDCVFCFVDQNPKGLRQPLYFRDGDYRLSFMYGNYTTMTNAGPAILDRIIRQKLSPQYVSVHVTDYEVRKHLMGLRKDDRILEKIRLLHDNGIDMHTQIVLCPGINDGEILTKTIADLYRFHHRIISLAIVPVGLTDHRFGLHQLKKVDARYAGELLAAIGPMQKRFRASIGRNFVYPSDEFYLLADREVPGTKQYDGFHQLENGVGMVRSFLNEFRRQQKKFPEKLPEARRLTVVTAELPAKIIQETVLPRLKTIRNLSVTLEVVPNRLFGRSVTVAGLLSGKCIYSAMKRRDCGDLLLLPPEVLNADGRLLDDSTLQELGEKLDARVMMFDGDWRSVFGRLSRKKEYADRELATVVS